MDHQTNNGRIYNPMNHLFPFTTANSNPSNSANENNSTSGSGLSRFLENSNLPMNDFNNNDILRKDFISNVQQTNPFSANNQGNNNNTGPFFDQRNNNNNTFASNYSNSSISNYLSLNNNNNNSNNSTVNSPQPWPIMKNGNDLYTNSQHQSNETGTNGGPAFQGNYQNLFENPFNLDNNQIFPTPPNLARPNTAANNNSFLLLNNNNASALSNGSVLSSDNDDMMSRTSQGSKVLKKTSSTDRKQAPTIATGRRNLKSEPVEPDEAERRMKRRERNRRSAQKCRERKVQRTQELQAQVEALKMEANNLLRELDSWRMQAKHCVQLLRQHCPHVAIPPMYFACLAEDERLSRSTQIICNTSNNNNNMSQRLQSENADRSTTEQMPSNGTFSSNSGILDEQIQLDYNPSEGISASTHSINSCTPNSNGSVEHSSSMPDNMNSMECDSMTNKHLHSSSSDHSGSEAKLASSMVDINSNCIGNVIYSNDIKPKDLNQAKSLMKAHYPTQQQANNMCSPSAAGKYPEPSYTSMANAMKMEPI